MNSEGEEWITEEGMSKPIKAERKSAENRKTFVYGRTVAEVFSFFSGSFCGRRASSYNRKKEYTGDKQDAGTVPQYSMEEDRSIYSGDDTHNGEYDRQRLMLIPSAIHDILHEGEYLIAGPVEDQAGGRTVKQHQKEERHGIHTDLVFSGQILRIDLTGDDVDQSHEDRHDIDRETGDGQKMIRFTQILEKPEGNSGHHLIIRQEVIRGNEERDLKDNGKRTAKRVKRRIVVLPVVGLEKHEPLIPVKCFLQVGNSGSKLRFTVMFLFLDLIGPVIKRQQKKIHGKAHRDDRKPDIA